MARLLVIEADTSLREVMVTLLELSGHETIQARAGEAGVALAVAELPDLVLCGLRLPGFDGLEVLAALRENPATATMPFILVESHLSASNLNQARQLQVSELLIKPFTDTELLHKMESVLNQ